jgi:hypothetical protein
LNLPEDSDHGTQGAVHRFNPFTLNEVLPAFVIDAAECHHPQGMAIDSDNFDPSHVLLACNGAVTTGPNAGHLNSVIIFGDDGDTFRVLVDQGSADEAWFEPVSRHFFIAEGRCSADCGSATNNVSPASNKQGIQTLGIIDSTTLDINDPFFGGQNVFLAFQGSTTRNTHSVAAWSGALGALGNFTIAFVPIPASGGASPATAAPFSSTMCGAFATTGCIGMVAVSPIPGGPEF